MTDLFKKTFSLASNDPWVEVAVPGFKGGMEEEIVSFRISDIAQLKSIGEKNSMILLHSKMEYLFDLSHADLSSKIYTAETTVDLKPHTIFIGAEQLKTKLTKEFEAAAKRKENSYVDGLTFKAYERDSKKDKFVAYSFSGADINKNDITESTSWLRDSKLIVTLGLVDPKGGPFGNGKIIMEKMNIEEFKRSCEATSAAGRREVDLLKQTFYQLQPDPIEYTR